MNGRIQSRTQPMATTNAHGVKQTVYSVTVKTTPFFDASEGFVYNVQSFGMIMSPIAMAFGMYLAFSAHNELQRAVAGVFDDMDEAALAQPVIPRGILNPPDA